MLVYDLETIDDIFRLILFELSKLIFELNSELLYTGNRLFS